MKQLSHNTKFHMKDNMLNKLHNRELNMYQSLDQLLNTKPLTKLTINLFKELTLTTNKLNILQNMSHNTSMSQELNMSLKKELNNTFNINPFKDNKLLPTQLFNNPLSNNQSNNNQSNMFNNHSFNNHMFNNPFNMFNNQ